MAVSAAGPSRNGIIAAVDRPVKMPWLHSQPNATTAPANDVNTTHWIRCAGEGTQMARAP